MLTYDLQVCWKRGLQRSNDANTPTYLTTACLGVLAFRLKKFSEAIKHFSTTLQTLAKLEGSWLLQDEVLRTQELLAGFINCAVSGNYFI